MAEKSNPTPEKAQDNASPQSNGAKDQHAVVSEVELLEARLQAAEQQREEYLTLARQTRADFENYQKRFQRDLATERRFAQAPLAGDLLPALDNLERALDSARQAGDTGALVQGVGMVQAQLLDLLRRHGVTRVEAQGQPFDPNLHQAVGQQPSAEQPPGTVLQVLEPGYMIHDRVLRPARVIVSAAPA
jgi:molecular chaperone GrpE